MSVTCPLPAKGCSAAQDLLTASWREPPSAQPMMLTRLRNPFTSDILGDCFNLRLEDEAGEERRDLGMGIAHVSKFLSAG